MGNTHLTRRRLLGGAVLVATCATGRASGDQPSLPETEVEPAAPAVPELPPFHSGPFVPTERDIAEWQAFKRRFVMADGRVVDNGNGGISHSEGQGWGLLFSVAFNDRATFDRILRWTSVALRRPNDALHAWCYRPGEANPVRDLNAATDGDLFIAAALARAAARWGNANYALKASEIARDVLRLLVVDVGSRLVLLPGPYGFDKPDAVVINPSYYALAVFQDLATVAPSPVWKRLHTDGLALIADGRFGRWRLPPDWLQASRRDGRLKPAPNWPARFSYDAIRVPLYLSWANACRSVIQQDFSEYFAARQSRLPAWVDLVTNSVAPYAATPGMLAVAMFVTRTPGMNMVDGLPSVELSPDYYSASLTLLSRIAWKESLQT